MKTVRALIPPEREELSAGELFGRMWLARSGLTVLLARDGEEKARILRSLQEALSAAGGRAEEEARARPSGPGAVARLRPGRSNGTAATHAEALIIGARDLGGPAGTAAGDLAERLGGAAFPERSARLAIAALRTGAATLLADDGSNGRIAQLTARVRALDDELGAAREADNAERVRLEALLTAAAPIADLAGERDRAMAERERWRVLIQLWPQWQRLQQARDDAEKLARFERCPADAEMRFAALEERSARAEHALRSARRRRSELTKERDQLGSETEPAATGIEADAARLCAEVPAYRSRLLALAATRARLADLERTLARGVERFGRHWDAARLAETNLMTTRGDELQGWQERGQCTRTARADAERTVGAARQRVRALCTQVSEELARDPLGPGDEVDSHWRSLWQLRSHLEEIWDVQSGAESSARALSDREDTMRGVDATTDWTPSPGLLGALSGLAVLAAVGTLWWGILRGPVSAAPLFGLAAMLTLSRLGVHVRAQWVGVLDQRRRTSREQLRGEIAQLRRRRDASWTRAAQLTDAIREAGVRLGLPDPVTPEAVESCEQGLAGRLRSDGAHTHLTALLLQLLGAQEEEQHGAARLAAADAERQTLEGEWEAWRRDAGLPDEIEIERSAEWLDELCRLAAARSAREATRDELLALEPVTGAWEADARRLLQRAGVGCSPELCGSALAAELSGLAVRLRHETERRTRFVEVESELRQAERTQGEAEAGLAQAGAALQELLAASGAGDTAALRAQLDGLRRWREAREGARQLQASIDDTLQRLDAAADARAELARGGIERWEEALRRSDARLGEIGGQWDDAAQQQQAAERCLEAARTATQVSDLRQERAELAAELTDVAREWKRRVLAAALLEQSLQECKRTERRELLQAASQALATLTEGRHTEIVRSEQPARLALVDREGHRLPIDALGEPLLRHVHLSLLLGWAAECTRRDTAVQFVFDDVLSPLALADAQQVAQGIGMLARTHPVLYLTTVARRGHTLSAMPRDVAVLDTTAPFPTSTRK